MTDSERIRNLELAVERLCGVIERIDTKATGWVSFSDGVNTKTELSLIKQVINGDFGAMAR